MQRVFLFLLFLLEATPLAAQPEAVRRLMEVYSSIVGYRDNLLHFADGSTLEYDDGKTKSVAEALDDADVEDMFREPYNRTMPPVNDAGRIRSDALFRMLYGNSAAEVDGHLEWVDWCPRLVGQRLRITRLYGAAEALSRISDELDNHPEWALYLKGASTVNWRKIAGTNRLSAHSFGIAIDICVEHSDYWRWSKSGEYRNRIPEELVAVFERNGFIWGGRWVHFDTMHFEYRPELLP